jgi:phospholipid/cholesterol/gamma-HCH transport system substrate-binding protein
MVTEHYVGRRFRVGLVVLIALIAVMIGIFMVGRRANLFKKKWPYETHFESAAGLVPGNPVRLNGVTVGNVLDVNLSPNPADQTVRVIYEVDRRVAPRLRTGTRASIKTIGLLGDKYIDLAGGTAAEPEVPIGGTIQAAPGAGIEKLLEGGGDLLTDLSAIARSLKNILGRTEEGKGFLGALTSETEESARLGNNLNATLASLNALLRKIESGKGLAGRLLTDERYGRQTGDALQAAVHSVQNVFGKIEESLRTNSGAIPALLADPEGKEKVYALVDALSRTAVSLAKITEDLQKGEGALPVLRGDERFGREFTENLRRFSSRLDSIGRKLDEGEGTIGRLINDPALFEAANDIVVGIDESKLLRWLIRNRQRSGIQKRYNETARRGAPAAAAEGNPGTGPAPPGAPRPTATPPSGP